MRKSPSVLLDDPPPPRLGLRNILAVMLGLAISPILYESSRLCAANWQGMHGEAPYVETPIIDAVGISLASASQAIGQSVERFVHDTPWNPRYVLAVGLAWVLIGSRLLRGLR
ncbi:MAG: hypothetical protein IRY99_07755 [Isosphaeraceae bacterium]|nr:hypothetical protein [Isosphaeraceae bacterium]